MHKHFILRLFFVVSMNICPCSTDTHFGHETYFCHWNFSLCSTNREFKQDKKFVLSSYTSPACLRKSHWIKMREGWSRPETWSRLSSQSVVSWMRNGSAALCPWHLSYSQFYCKTEQYTHMRSLSGSPNQSFCIVLGKSLIEKKNFFSLVYHIKKTGSSC